VSFALAARGRACRWGVGGGGGGGRVCTQFRFYKEVLAEVLKENNFYVIFKMKSSVDILFRGIVCLHRVTTVVQ
jgi:hypothetical protein